MPLSSVRFVTHKGTSLKIGITTKRGVVGFRMNSITSTGDHLWTQNVLKNTRFRESNPVVKFKGEPPF